ncbi:MAG TPA: hypothetical protein VID28_23255 [Methylomirabilota bacterium]
MNDRGRDPRRPIVLLLGVIAIAAGACGQTTTSASPSPPAAAAAAATANNAARPGEPVAEPATFHSLGVRWPVRGDANVNAMIGVHYRATGEAVWREALALFRTDPKSVPPENHVADGWLFAGSIVDLAPDTEYEVVLTLQDPDGGSVQRTLTMRTTAEPREPAGMRVRHVVPAASGDGGPGTGSRDDPFRGLRAAQAAAVPGDLFLLHAGVYAEGTWTVDHHGTAERPIIYRGAGDGDAVLDGGGRERLVSANRVRHVWLERLTLRHAEYLFVGHQGSHFVIRHCRLEVTGTGITAINGGYEESRGFVITDNVIQGPTTWPRSRGIESVNGVLISGAGHVVAYNRMSNLGDGVHGTGHGRLAASDINNNDIDASTDDGIEGDYADTNVRIYRNRITNAFSGISAQPSLGGPMYVFRNAIYNVLYSPFKLHNDTSGVLIFHNTSVRSGVPWLIDPAGETVNDVVTRNNLFIGTQAPALRSTGVMIRCHFDRDGYGGAGGPGEPYAPGGAVVVAARGNFAGGLEPPRDPERRQPSASVDLRLAPRSRAVDAGVRLPNFNDVFTGTGPDLGCCEVGQPLPHYGPRS